MSNNKIVVWSLLTSSYSYANTLVIILIINEAIELTVNSSYK